MLTAESDAATMEKIEVEINRLESETLEECAQRVKANAIAKESEAEEKAREKAREEERKKEKARKKRIVTTRNNKLMTTSGSSSTQSLQDECSCLRKVANYIVGKRMS